MFGREFKRIATGITDPQRYHIIHNRADMSLWSTWVSFHFIRLRILVRFHQFTISNLKNTENTKASLLMDNGDSSWVHQHRPIIDSHSSYNISCKLLNMHHIKRQTFNHLSDYAGSIEKLHHIVMAVKRYFGEVWKTHNNSFPEFKDIVRCPYIRLHFIVK